MSGYRITHTDDYEPEINKAEGMIFRNKDAVIEYLVLQLAMISGDMVEIRTRDGKLV
jgi:hypothetical protein